MRELGVGGNYQVLILLSSLFSQKFTSNLNDVTIDIPSPLGTVARAGEKCILLRN